MTEDYEPMIPDSEIRKLIKIDENGRKYILIKEYDRATDEHIINIVESYKGKIPDEIYLKISQKLTKNTLQI